MPKTMLSRIYHLESIAIRSTYHVELHCGIYPCADFGRGLKQTVTVNAASPAVSASLDASANPVSGFLGRMVTFLQSDADTLRVVFRTPSYLHCWVVLVLSCFPQAHLISPLACSLLDIRTSAPACMLLCEHCCLIS